MLKKKIYLLIGLIAFFSSLNSYAGTSESSEYHQTNHYNTPRGFMNDIQTIFKTSDGYYHMYYLLNSNYKLANNMDILIETNGSNRLQADLANFETW